tara:strand:+ start:129 stop:368 length:240 start_codon:yes stop_codon:yes gene_type:complete
MRKQKLKPSVQGATRGGYHAEVVEIDPGNFPDIYIGTIVARAGVRNVAWNDVGICRDNSDEANLTKEMREQLEARIDPN